ncbi:hypothetical protein Tco_0031683 [Tanacetum coccineum]
MELTMNQSVLMILLWLLDHPQPPQDSVDHQGILQALRKIQEELEEIKQDRKMKKENISIEEMRREQLMVDDEIKDISNYLSYKRFRGEKIDDEYERDCEIKIEQLLQDYNGLGIEIRKKELILMEENKPKAITPVLPIEEPDNSLSMGDEHLDTISSVEILVPIPSEFEGISNDTCDVPVCEDLSTLDALNDNFKILSDSNNDDVILREKLLNINRLIVNIESLNDNPSPDRVFKSPSLLLIPVMDSDSDENSSTFTPDLPTNEPDNSLSMGDEHLDTISSVEILVPIPSEFEGEISFDTCEVPFVVESLYLDAGCTDNFKNFIEFQNDGYFESDDDDFEDVEYEEVNDVDQ